MAKQDSTAGTGAGAPAQQPAARYRQRLIEAIGDNLAEAAAQRAAGYPALADWADARAEGLARALFLAAVYLEPGGDPSIGSTDVALELGRQRMAARAAAAGS